MLASISIGDSPRLQSILKILSKENTTYANELLQKNISVGDICSIFRERQCHLFKNAPLPNHLDALIKLADSGDVFAQYELGCYYDYNDNKLAFKYFKMAADQNHFFAQKELASSYFWGSGVDKDYRKSIELYKKIHEKGYYEERSIARCYHELDEYDKELEWLLIGNSRDEYGFSTSVGYFYRTGKDNYKNYAKSIEYYERSIELGASNGDSEYCIAEMYLEGGYGIMASRSTAREWMKKSATKELSAAQKWLKENPY